MTNIRTVLSKNMKALRKKKNISQAGLAEKIDTSPNYISKIEAEKQFPSVQMIEQIAMALDCDSVDLFSVNIIENNRIDLIQSDLMRNINSLIDKSFREIKRK